MEVTPIPETDDPDAPVMTPELTFEAGADLDPAVWLIQWDDHMEIADGYTTLSPDDGQGRWSYTVDATGCEAQFVQRSGPDPSLDPALGDRALSDRWLELVVPVDPADMAEYGTDAVVYDWPGDPAVSFRTIGGWDEAGGSRVDAARVFAAMDLFVLYVSVSCPPEVDAFAETTRLIDEIFAVAIAPLDAAP